VARRQRVADLAPALDGDRLEADLARLDASRRLVSHRALEVFAARASEIPAVLREIGRLRELAFRAAAEGTGRACDLDRYDADYWHLFVWNTGRREIAGAYRLAPTDAIAAAHDPRRLYTRSLFRFGREFLAGLGPAIELGRSFVHPDYQRDFGTLMLLWKGIGAFVARYPRYRMLFGPVSISNAYRPASRALLVSVLAGPRYRSPLAPLVKPLRPLHVGGLAAGWPAPGLPSGIDQIDELLAEIEGDGKGLPVLLRQYLKLNARLLSFSVDPAFSDVVDGLMVVDLLDVEATVLQRYMGTDGAARFLAHHAAHPAHAAVVRPAVAPV
jgi:putative hemolysin